MKQRLWKIRCWLIKKISGDTAVIINVSIHKGKIFLKEGDVFFSDTTLIENEFFCETPEMTTALKNSFEFEKNNAGGGG